MDSRSVFGPGAVAPPGGTEQLTGTAFGCPFAVTVPAELAVAAAAGLPVGWQPTGQPPRRQWALAAGPDGAWSVLADDAPIAAADDPRSGLALLLAELELWAAAQASGFVVVRAGAVAWRGQVIALPAGPGTGTSTLVAALVGAGAVYFSDRFLLLTREGRVAPYPCPLRLPDPDVPARRRATPAAELGGVSGSEPLPLALVANLVHDPVAGWAVHPLTAGHTVLTLVDRAVAVRHRPRGVMTHVLAAVPGTTGVAGTRGDADAAARHILGSGEPLGTAGRTAPASAR